MSDIVGFIGTGIMGSGMIRNLHAKGHVVGVWNRTMSKAQEIADSLGIEAFEALPDLARRCSTVVICVTSSDDVKEIVLGSQGIASGLKPGSLVIDCSTISPAVTRDIADALHRQTLAFIDAPVSGGSEGASHGTLSIMVGASEENFCRAESILNAIGTRVTHIGPVGAGQAAKLLNQVLVVVNMLAVAEALVLGKAAQLDLFKVIRALEHGAAGSWMLSKRGPQVLEEYWNPGFTIDLQVKDIELVREFARDLGVRLPTLERIYALYSELQARGEGGLGNHALIRAVDGWR
jgi:3-hydroxyisobutyrate dehydrogenase